MGRQYVDESLSETEKIVMRGRWPVVYWLGTWTVLATFILLAIGGYAWIPGSFVLPGLLVLVGLWLFAAPSIRMLTTEFAVTSKRVVLKWGWLNRKTAELAVESVESVQLAQSIWGRIFGYGRLIVTGTGDARIHFPPMAEPVKFRRAIESGRRKNDAPKPAAPAPAQ
ncbi:MAG: PH domain-containing protein [Hyphomonadaceae bacterium]|nr:PH domain-containing protein [Hyphomonadaceae bacterium]